MKTISLLLIGSALFSASEDKVWEKRNRQYQKSLARIREAGIAQRDLLQPWIQECESRGMKLNSDPQGFLKCFLAPAPPPPAPAPAKPPAAQ